MLKATEVDVLNPATLNWQSPIPIPGGGASVQYNAMALSPDGSSLVTSSPGGSVAVINPDSPAQASVVQISTNPGFQSGSLAITKFNTALVAGAPNIEIDLSNLSVTPIAAHMGDLVRASADGSALYGVDLNVTSGQLYSIDPSTFSVKTATPFGQLFWSDLTVAFDGSHFAAIDGSPVIPGDLVGFFNPGMDLLNSNPYPLLSQPDDVQVLGSAFSPGGKVLVVPLGDSIEFWDATTGTLRARLMTPEELSFLVYPEGPAAPRLALDASGQTIFAISASGLTVMKLAEPIDDIPPAPWAPLSVPATVTRSVQSAGIAARAAAMHASQAGRKSR